MIRPPIPASARRRPGPAALLALAAVTAAGATGPHAGEAATAGSGAAGTSATWTFTDNWGNGPGCKPLAAEARVEGLVDVRPFGKGSDGAVIRSATGDWVVSYNAPPELRRLHGQRVVARGFPCAKAGESVAGPHLDLRAVTEQAP